MDSRRLAVLTLADVSLGVGLGLVVNLQLIFRQFNSGAKSLLGEDEADDPQPLAFSQRLLDSFLLGVDVVTVDDVS